MNDKQQNITWLQERSTINNLYKSLFNLNLTS